MNHILIATDFSNEADRGLMRAVKLALRRKAVLTILHVVDCEPAERAAAIERAELRLDATARELHDTFGVIAIPRVVASTVADSIVAAAERINAELIVLGARDRSLFSGVLLGTTTDRVARTANVPVLVVKSEPEIPYRLGLAAVDFSKCSRLALERMLALGILSRGRLIVLHVFDVLAKGVLHCIGVEREHIEGYVSDVSGKALRETQTFVNDIEFGSVAHTIVLREGKPADAIHQAAEKFRPDLVVIGKHERNVVTRAFLGSVAEDVLLRARQDVLVVPGNS